MTMKPNMNASTVLPMKRLHFERTKSLLFEHNVRKI